MVLSATIEARPTATIVKNGLVFLRVRQMGNPFDSMTYFQSLLFAVYCFYACIPKSS